MFRRSRSNSFLKDFQKKRYTLLLLTGEREKDRQSWRKCLGPVLLSVFQTPTDLDVLTKRKGFSRGTEGRTWCPTTHTGVLGLPLHDFLSFDDPSKDEVSSTTPVSAYPSYQGLCVRRSTPPSRRTPGWGTSRSVSCLGGPHSTTFCCLEVCRGC